MRELRAGERIDLAAGSHALRLSARVTDVLARRIGALVVPLGADGKLVGDFGPLDGHTRELRPGLAFVEGYGIDVDTAALPGGVERLVVVLYVIGGAASGTSLADLGTLTSEVASLRFTVDLTGRREAALIAVEFYRRGAGWRLSANGQGFIGGIGAIAHALGVTLDVPQAQAAPGNRRDERHDERPPAGSSSGGSGFAVAPRLIVTNHHVISHATRISAAGESRTGPAELVASDPHNDIALLRLDGDARGLARFRTDDIDLGEDVIVGGFPLSDLLGHGPQISGGNVSALTGMGNDSSELQFNAPIGSGSSGGPVLDCSGLVVALVKSVLRTDTAPVAQNINFAVKAALVRSFLHAAGVTVATVPAAAPRGRADIARDARAYLYRLHIEY